MRIRTLVSASLVALVASVARGGVGVWTTNPPSGPGYRLAADSGLSGVVYTEKARSADNGLTWQSDALESYQPIWIAAGTPGTAYLSAQLDGGGAILATTDAGLHWTVVTSRVSSTPPLQVGFSYVYADPRTPGVLYTQFNQQNPAPAPGSTSLEKSVDGGRTWTTTGLSQRGSDFEVLSLAFDPGNSDNIDAAVFSPENGYLAFRSSDGGSSWEPLPSAGPVYQFVFDPHSPGTAYAVGFDRLLKSTDGGVTFAPIETTPIRITKLVISPTASGRFFALSNESVFTSSDWGATWSPLSSGFPNSLMNDLAIDSTGQFLHTALADGVVYDYQLDQALVLNPSHPFSVSLTAIDPRTGRVGAGVWTGVNDLWGYFSIPEITGNPNNPEVFVKLLDGTGLNGSYWFFFGGLTNLEYTLTVTELATGRQKTYTNPAGSECGGSDTAAFVP